MADLVIRVLTAVVVLALGAVAAVVSYSHALEVALAHGQSGLTAHLTPLTVDGLVLVAGLVMLDSARRARRAPVLAWVTLALGIGATLGVNVLYGLAYGPVGAVVAGWPAVALVLSSELLMGLIRRGQKGARLVSTPDDEKGVHTMDTPGDRDSVPVILGDEKGRHTVTTPGGEGYALVRTPGGPQVDEGGTNRSSPAEDSGLFPVATADPLLATAREHFAATLSVDALPSVRQLRRELRIGHPRAVRLREALSES